MAEQKRKPRPVNIFEAKSLIDYIKGLTLNNIKYGCVRAKELDDKQGGNKNTSYLLAMHELSNAIRLELGLKAAPVKGKAGKADNKVVKELSESVSNLATMAKELEDTKDDLKETEEAMDLAMEATSNMEATLAAVNEANKALTIVNEKLIKEATKKPTTKKVTNQKKVTSKKETK